jgi:hypothetical protein
MFRGISQALKGISGEYEVVRTVGAFGVLIYAMTGAGVTIYIAIIKQTFDIVAFCTAFPGGLAVAIGAVAGAVAVKDRNVSTAIVTRSTAEPPANEKVA